MTTRATHRVGRRGPRAADSRHPAGVTGWTETSGSGCMTVQDGMTGEPTWPRRYTPSIISRQDDVWTRAHHRRIHAPHPSRRDEGGQDEASGRRQGLCGHPATRLAHTAEHPMALPEVPVRPGAPMRVHAVHMPHPDEVHRGIRSKSGASSRGLPDGTPRLRVWSVRRRLRDRTRSEETLRGWQTEFGDTRPVLPLLG